MKLSLNLIPECPTAEIVALAVQAERLGFDRCWVYDEGLVTRDVYVVLTAIAAATQRLELGPGITNPYTRHPAQTASAIASLDEVSGGRAFLGVGAGGTLTLDPIGMTRRRPLAAVAQTIDVARRLFTGSPVDYAGDSVALSGAAMVYGRANTEVWLAGRGPKMLALGGRLADGVMLDFIHKARLGDAIAQVRASGGRRICYSTSIITTHDDLEAVRPHMTYRLVDAPPAVQQQIGLTEQDAATIRAAMAGGLEAAAVHVRDEWIEPFVLQGSPAEWSAELSDLCERHDIEEFLLPVFEMPDPAAYLTRVASALR